MDELIEQTLNEVERFMIKIVVSMMLHRGVDFTKTVMAAVQDKIDNETQSIH